MAGGALCCAKQRSTATNTSRVRNENESLDRVRMIFNLPDRRNRVLAGIVGWHHRTTANGRMPDLVDRTSLTATRRTFLEVGARRFYLECPQGSAYCATTTRSSAKIAEKLHGKARPAAELPPSCRVNPTRDLPLSNLMRVAVKRSCSRYNAGHLTNQKSGRTNSLRIGAHSRLAGQNFKSVIRNPNSEITAMPDTSQLRLLILGAHPDDAEFHAGGLAAIYREAGHHVRMISVTNGESGHFRISGKELVNIRRSEARAAGKVIGAT